MTTFKLSFRDLLFRLDAGEDVLESPDFPDYVGVEMVCKYSARGHELRHLDKIRSNHSRKQKTPMISVFFVL